MTTDDLDRLAVEALIEQVGQEYPLRWPAEVRPDSIPMRGVVLGVLIGALIWLLLISWLLA